jgi:glycosyltransferase involved in cell wall biosynthesis
MMPELSIITVCFNEVKRIALTCESIVNQTFQDFEWIVIDGGSTDGTLDILKRYEQRMNYFVSEPDRGIYHAMNKGIAQAHGAYLLFLNGGDYLHQEDTLVQVFNPNKVLTKDIYYGDALFQREGSFKYHTPKFQDYYSRFLTKTFQHQSTFIKRKLFEIYGFYDESFLISADLDFFLRVLISNPKRKEHSIEHLPFAISVYENIQGLSTRDIELRELENTLARKRHYPCYYLIWHRITTWLRLYKNYSAHKVKRLIEKIGLQRKTCQR